MEKVFSLIETFYFFMWLIIGMIFLITIIIAGTFTIGYLMGLSIDFLAHLFTGHHIDGLIGLPFPVLFGVIFTAVVLIRES